jgi:thymidylate kinase
MIIELFGPPGVGKTTFAGALTASLREHGHRVEPVVSYRPAEQSPAGSPQAIAAVRRVIRPVMETLAVARRRPAGAHEVGTPAGLIRLLPPRNLLWSVRLHQYLLRLFRSWELASSAGHVVLFDQAFVQAVCSLALLGRAPDWTLVAVALDAVPKPDLLIRLGADQDILEARLVERQRRQSRMEQLLELDLQANLRSIGIIESLHGLLRARGRPVTCVDCSGPDALRDAVARTEADMTARFGAAGFGAEQAVMA